MGEQRVLSAAFPLHALSRRWMSRMEAGRVCLAQSWFQGRCYSALLWSSSISQQTAASPALWGLVLFLDWLEK